MRALSSDQSTRFVEERLCFKCGQRVPHRQFKHHSPTGLITYHWLPIRHRWIGGAQCLP